MDGSSRPVSENQQQHIRNMNTSLIARRAVIASFNSGQWRTRRVHAAETRAENARHGLTDEARVDVRICKHASLEEAARIVTAARADHYRLTVPAVDRGMRLLAGARQLEHSATMQRHAAAFQAAVAAFVGDYEAVRADAPSRLNGLYIAAHWPDVEVVRRSFRLECRYLPVPSLGQWDEWLRESADAAASELRERIGEALRAYAEKLADPSKIFRDSLVENLADVLNIAADLNLGGDQQISALVEQARSLATVDPDQLREDKALRAESANRAADLCSLFSL